MEIKLKKVHTAKDLAISAIMTAAGIGLFFVNAGIGVVVAVCGILMLLFWKDGYRREGENIILHKKAFDVAHSCRESLKGFLDGKDVEPIVDTTAIGGIIRLEVFYNAEAQVAYAQIFDFSSYTYEPATELTELRGPRAKTLTDKI